MKQFVINYAIKRANMSKEEIKEIQVTEIFQDKYVVPIYQRKYSWTDKEIEQLLEDIINREENDKYFLGTLTVDKKEDGSYEVIDGQQRLTTLCLIMIYLNKHIDGLDKNIDNMPSFEARQIYDNAINSLKNIKENEEITGYEDNVKEIYDGYRCIENYFKNNDSNSDKFLKKLDNTFLVRVQVPKNTDLNHYFEIMNTRGEQLELHHIAKAKFLDVIKDIEDKKTASIIWDACSQMNTHIQMNFIKNIREKLFTEYLSCSNGNFPTKDSIEDVWNKLQGIFKEAADNEDRKKLENIIQEIKDGNSDKQTDENKDKNTNNEKPERFESVIKFPYFLLYVNAVINKEEKGKDEKDKYEFDDKNLLNILKNNWEDENKETNAKYFIYAMLYCRILFDKYIIKKQNDDNNQINDKFILEYVKNDKGEMGNTYGKTDNNNNYEDDEDSKETYNDKDYTRQQLIALQSLLRITYTSPRNMKWITILLKHLFDGKDAGLASVTSVLENYCIGRIKEHYDIKESAKIEDFDKKRYNDIERIVFTYLDYILYRDGYKEIIKPKFNNWKVQFRNSVEHFFPQNPENKERWEDEYLDCFGNLALVTVSGNSKFSNLSPKAKIAQYKGKDMIEQNPKLKIMASYTENDGEWTPEKAKEHQKEMFETLAKEINGKNK